MPRLWDGPGMGCSLDDGPCNNCGYCHDEDGAVTMTAEELDAERGDEQRAAERDEELYLSIVREQEGSI